MTANIISTIDLADRLGLPHRVVRSAVERNMGRLHRLGDVPGIGGSGRRRCARPAAYALSPRQETVMLTVLQGSAVAADEVDGVLDELARLREMVGVEMERLDSIRHEIDACRRELPVLVEQIKAGGAVAAACGRGLSIAGRSNSARERRRSALEERMDRLAQMWLFGDDLIPSACIPAAPDLLSPSSIGIVPAM